MCWKMNIWHRHKWCITGVNVSSHVMKQILSDISKMKNVISMIITMYKTYLCKNKYHLYILCNVQVLSDYIYIILSIYFLLYYVPFHKNCILLQSTKH